MAEQGKVRRELPWIDISLHLHDTRGLGPVNMFAGYKEFGFLTCAPEAWVDVPSSKAPLEMSRRKMPGICWMQSGSQRALI